MGLSYPISGKAFFIRGSVRFGEHFRSGNPDRDRVLKNNVKVGGFARAMVIIPIN